MSGLLPYPSTHAVGRVLALDTLLALITAQQGDPRTAILAVEFENYVNALRDTIAALAQGLPPDMKRELMRIRGAFGALLHEGATGQEGIPWRELTEEEHEARWVGLRLRAIRVPEEDRSHPWAWTVSRVIESAEGTEHGERFEPIGQGRTRALEFAKRFAAAVAISSIGTNLPDRSGP